MRTPLYRSLVIPVALASLAFACGARDEADDQPLTRRNMVTIAVTDDGLLVRHTDINDDGTPDLSKYFHVRDSDGNPVTDPALLRVNSYTDLRLARKETDTNFDGRIDVVRHYSPAEVPTREEADTDFDGVVDLVSLFEQGVRSAATIDADGDGHPELRRVYRSGALVRVEIFTNRSDAPSLYEYYEDNELVRIGEDFNGDAVIDQWTRRRSNNVAAVPRVSGPSAGVVSTPTPEDGEPAAVDAPADPAEATEPGVPAAQDSVTTEPDSGSAPAAEGSGATP